MNDEPKHSPTPITVDSDVTPITQQPVPKVASSQWDLLSLTELHNELQVLINRKTVLLNMGKRDMAANIERGILLIQQMIENKYQQQSDKNNQGYKNNDPPSIF